MPAATERSAEQMQAEAFAWLAGLPAGREITWTTHHLSEALPFTRGWVDVDVPELCAAVGWNWAFTVEQTDWYEDAKTTDDLPISVDDPFSFPVAFDGFVELQLDEAGLPSRLRLRHPGDRLQDLDASLSDVRADECWRMLVDFQPDAADLLGRHYPATSLEVTLDGERWWQTPVWTAYGLSAGLERWAADRGYDVVFRYSAAE